MASLDAALKDLRFAWRLVWRRPLLTITAVLTVAFGVGANTAVVSVLETVLLNPLGIRDASRVMVSRVRLDKLNMRHSTMSGVEFQEIQAMTEVFSAVAAAEPHVWTGEAGGQAARLTGSSVTPDFFRVFGERPALGRFFEPEDRQSAVLSYAAWQSQFGGDAGVAGRALMLDGQPYRIVGVAPQSFRFPAAAQLWVPLTLTPDRLRRGYNMTLTTFARLKSGVSQEQALDRVMRYSASLVAQNKDLANIRYGFELDPLGTYVAGSLERPLWILWVAALVVLLTGCANVAGLLLARSGQRRREVAIRVSVGATRTQLLRQLLIENLLLGAMGGVAGLVLAAVAARLLGGLALPSKSLLALVAVNRKLLAYGLALAGGSAVLFGIAPSIQLLRSSQTSAMVRSRRRWFQDGFVIAQVGGAFALTAISALLIRSLWSVEAVRPGFDPRNVTTASLILPKNDPTFARRLEPALAAIPGVESAALAYSIPFHGGGATSGFNIRNRERAPGEPEWHGEAYMVTPRYFETLRIPVLRGRAIADSDVSGAPLVCVIDARLASRFFAAQDPIGQEIAMYRGWARIVGVVGAIQSDSLETESRAAVYYSLAQVPLGWPVTMLARVRVPAAAGMREAVRRTNASVPVFDVKSMDDLIGESLGVRRVMVLLLSIFGAVTLLLAVIGIYGVVAQIVSERTQEIGVRLALGARPGQILGRFLTRGLRSGLAGLMLGIGAAAYAQHWIAAMLYGVKPFDLAIWAGTAVAVMAMLLAAVWWPARRASRLDAQDALRHD